MAEDCEREGVRDRHTNCREFLAAMAVAMRSLQASSLVGRATAVAEVSTTQPASLRCAWKGVGFKTGGFSASIPRREVNVRHAGPRSSVGPSGGGGGEGRFSCLSISGVGGIEPGFLVPAGLCVRFSEWVCGFSGSGGCAVNCETVLSSGCFRSSFVIL